MRHGPQYAPLPQVYAIAHSGESVDLTASKIEIQDGHLVGMDDAGKVVFTYAPGFWTSCTVRQRAAGRCGPCGAWICA